jgi:signal transduction histidine kinase
MIAMAEVAIGALHNVGNVLNSINVSVTMLSDNLRRSRFHDVKRVAELMNAHKDNLGLFLTSDSKGQRVIDFLLQLAERLTLEQTAQARELAWLHSNIAHIKEIVSTQQARAKVSGAAEFVRISDLVEDTLKLEEAFLQSDAVRVIRKYGEVPEISVDKHKVLQILINLIRNAKSACDETGRPDKELTVSVRTNNNHVQICVNDNGIGIPPENLKRIFDHGFTTKRDGHGFGLHSGALTAKELGGSLTAYSEGPSQGATFTLELPLFPSNVT